MLNSVGSNIWYTDHPLSVMGIPLGTRMTVVKLRDGRLFLHSPTPLDERAHTELCNLGTPSYTIAPNKYHHLFAHHFPEAKLFAAPGVAEKCKDLKVFAKLGATPPVEWMNELEQLCIEGVPEYNEVVFFHRESRTLIVTDCFFNQQKVSSLLSKIFFTLTGTYGRLAISRIMFMAVKNKQAFENSLLKLLNWDFDNLIMAHGEPIIGGAKAQLEQLFRARGLL